MEKLPPGQNVLWTDPGDVSGLDLTYGVGGRDMQPQPPFTFLSEDLSGSTAKASVRDAAGKTWNVKWGKEAHPDVFGTRMAWACGYVAQPEYYVSEGRIEGVHGHLKRIDSEIRRDGSFEPARFQLRAADPRFLKDAGWSWVNNPFRGTPQVHGLKILMMLVSDWDDKDSRDQGRDSNLAVFQTPGQYTPKYLYFVSDWGGSMGRWGNVATRDKWDAKGFAEQTPDFIKGLHDGRIEWGYAGQHSDDQVRNIRISDVQWLLQYLGRLSDDQIRAGLAASGATSAEVDSFTASLRARIAALAKVAGAE